MWRQSCQNSMRMLFAECFSNVHADAHGLPVIVAQDDGVLNAVCDESRTTNDAKVYTSSSSNTEGNIF